MISQDKFYEITKILLDDTFSFLASEQGQELKIIGAPPEYFRYLKITPRRRIGKTYTGFNLMFDDAYYPAMMVFPVGHFKRDAMRQWEQTKFLIVKPASIFTASEVLNHDFLPSLGGRTRQGQTSPHPPKFKLGIIDDRNALSQWFSLDRINELRCTMFACCDVVLEMG